MKILNFGSCNIDYVYQLEHIVTDGETEQSVQMDIFPGGKGLNQSVAAARAGAPVYHAAVIGTDGGFLAANKLAGKDTLEIFCLPNPDGTQLQLISLFDNLGKGSSGAAVQCMNLMLGLEETKGLAR